MNRGKIFGIAAGIILILSSAAIGIAEQLVQPGTLVPAAAGAALVLLCLIWNRWRRARLVLLGIFAVGAGIYAAAEACVFSGIHPEPVQERDYAVVLGCGLYGDEPSELLVQRLETAAHYARTYPQCRLVLSGGKGTDETLSEAEAMRRYLIRDGIAPERLIVENASRNTRENLRNSAELLDGLEGAGRHQCVVISNDFHLYRAERLARQAGLDVQTLAAPTPVITVGMFLREGITVVFFWANTLLAYI